MITLSDQFVGERVSQSSAAVRLFVIVKCLAT